ncbi:EAL domain-containing protein, partial [Undibacterium sp.]|uniref:two-component system response regulator n=1 Tax=Undibacterium sp. TaxID=1914977 RepID=UPI00374CBA63
MPRILIVDDREENRYLLQTLLQGHSYAVDLATDGAEALAQARREAPNLIITDILMPVMDGFRLCREWKADPRLQHIPLAFYTATYTDSKDEAYALGLGADAFITKPTDPDDLLLLISDLLQQKQPPASSRFRQDEAQGLKEYNTVLIQKLEHKIAQLEAASFRATQNEQRLTLALEVEEAGIWDWDLLSGVILWNDRHAYLFGLEAEEFDGRYESFRSRIHPADIDAVELASAAARDQHNDYCSDFRVVWPDGSVHWIAARGRYLYDAQGKPTRMCGVIVESTVRKNNEEQMRLASQVFESSHEAIIITDPQAHIIAVNSAFCKSTGYTNEEIVGVNAGILRADEQSADYFNALWKDLRKDKHWHGELNNRRKDGSSYPARLSVSTVDDGQGQTTHYIGIITDLSSYKAAEERIQYMAYFDSLSELPNRTLLRDRAAHALAAARRDRTEVAMMFLDLDHFKTINDSLGHSVGDQVLQTVASRLKFMIREADTVARYGGDEFSVLLSNTDTKGAAQVAQKIIETLAAPIEVGNHSLVISASIGISCFPADADDFEALLKNSDIALFRAKGAGRSNFQFFTQEMNTSAHNRLELEVALRGALADNQFQLYYQPQFDLRSGELLGFEALLRWIHPVRGIIPPLEFIPIAEINGLIVPIGNWVLREACRQAKEWQTRGVTQAMVAVNLSAVQIRQANIVNIVKEALEASELDPKYLELELTESLLLENVESVLTQLHQLKEIGVTLSIDDFGTGYSSLSYLKRFPIDTLKIDKSFVLNLTED